MTAAPMPDSVTLDNLDRQIVRCLQLRPRAPFSLVAAALDVTEQTVARRYRRLHRHGLLRVIAVVSPRALGQSDWLLRVRCRPEGALDVGRALAQRDDIAWVSVGAGGSELVCAVRSHTQEAREWLLLDRLPRTSAVLGMDAAVILRHFVGGSASDWVGVAGVLTDQQSARLGTDPRPSAPSVGTVLTGEDYAMLAVLGKDGRASYRDLARAARTTEGKVTRRLTALIGSGVVYLDVDLASGSLGFGASAYVWLTVAPAHLAAACEALATHEETPFVAAVSGRTNVVASVTCRDLDHLYDYVTTKIGGIEGVQAVEVSPVVRKLKQAGTLMDGDRLARPS